MKIVFLVMGSLFLGASFAWTFGTEDELPVTCAPDPMPCGALVS